MQANNALMIVGRVGRDPETRTIASGKAVTKFSVAVNRPGRDKGTDWFSVSLWGKQAELAADLIRKGALVSIVGAMHINKGNDGKVWPTVEASGFQLLGSREDGGRSERAESAADDLANFRQGATDDDDIPPF